MNKPNMSAIAIKKDDYKAIKRMDRIQLTEYLSRVWKRGYEAGKKAIKENVPPQPENKAYLQTLFLERGSER